MPTIVWILAGGLLMSAIALVGGLTTVLPRKTLERLLAPMVALAAGTLLGGAVFHMLPAGLSDGVLRTQLAWVVVGFVAFLALEQFLHWHHCRRASADCRRPMTYLILLGDALHNFLGGLAVAGAFLIDFRLGLSAWLAAAAHEVPQELGDFGVLIFGGWERRRALLFNLLSGLTFLVGALLAYALSFRFDMRPLVLIGAGNFIYIAASDLIPEIRAHERLGRSVETFLTLGVGLLLMYGLALVFQG
jgi:zinc and cadmium transporter